MEFVIPPKQEFDGIRTELISCFMSNQTQELSQIKIANQLISCCGKPNGLLRQDLILQRHIYQGVREQCPDSGFLLLLFFCFGKNSKFCILKRVALLPSSYS